jgi:hypothetical protein
MAPRRKAAAKKKKTAVELPGGALQTTFQVEGGFLLLIFNLIF